MSFAWRKLATAFLLLLFCAGCSAGIARQPASAAAGARVQPLQYAGRGETSLSIGPWRGTAVLHVVAGKGRQSFSLVLEDGQEQITLLSQPAPVDEYRALTFPGQQPLRAAVLGDAEWELSLLPPTPEHFPVLKAPGTYRGRGSAVILLEGEHSIAIFDSPDLGALNAWAYPLEGDGERLVFKTGGDYPGRAVLPKTAAWLLIVAPLPWSVEVQSPCCEAPNGLP